MTVRVVRSSGRLVRAAIAVCVLATGCGASPTRETGAAVSLPPGQEAFDYAFRFASAIHADPKDMGKAQEAVTADLAREGRLERAAECADEIVGWRRGTAYADLAAMFAERGDLERARSYVDRAEQVRSEIVGWQNLRIRAHVAHAQAMLGDLAATRQASAEVAAADARQYRGRAVALMAAGYAARGEFEAAMEQLEFLSGEEEIDVSWWRTVGFLEVAKQGAATEEQRSEALRAALRSAETVPGWKQVEALVEIAQLLAESGRTERAISTMEPLDERFGALPDTMPVKVPLMSRAARVWAACGEAERARTLLAGAEQSVEATLNIERAGLYAAVASAYRTVGGDAEAQRVYDEAFTAAEQLVNARPRALSVVEICRELGRSAAELDAGTRARLESLFAGLGDPW